MKKEFFFLLKKKEEAKVNRRNSNIYGIAIGHPRKSKN